MRLARSLVLLLAVSSATGAALLVHKVARSSAKPPQAARLDTVEILVAARPLAVGELVGKDQVRWQAWPSHAVPAGSIRRGPDVNAPALPFESSPARFPLLEGEPIAATKLARPEHGSVLAALLSPGMRAVSVPIREETSAGGFIQPHDRVDVIVTRKARDAGQDRARSETLLRGMKVLAMGKVLDGKAAAAGRSATLELAPAQARILAAAQSTGEVSLALIGAGDVTQTDISASEAAPAEVSVMKFGRSAPAQTIY